MKAICLVFHQFPSISRSQLWLPAPWGDLWKWSCCLVPCRGKGQWRSGISYKKHIRNEDYSPITYLWFWFKVLIYYWKRWYSRLHLPTHLHPQLNPCGGLLDGQYGTIHQLSCELLLGNFGKSTSNTARLKKIEAILGEAFLQRWFSKEAVGIIIEVIRGKRAAHWGLYHRNQKFLDDYEYTSQPPTIIGSGFSGDVVLCRRKDKTAVVQNQENLGARLSLF